MNEKRIEGLACNILFINWNSFYTQVIYLLGAKHFTKRVICNSAGLSKFLVPISNALVIKWSLTTLTSKLTLN
jgi:hypothetical protein